MGKDNVVNFLSKHRYTTTTATTILYIYNFIRHIGSHIQYEKEAICSKQYDEKVNNSVTIFNNTFELVT